jgi:hypothetical protein
MEEVLKPMTSSSFIKDNHCCPRQDRVVPRFAESKGLESAATQISD